MSPEAQSLDFIARGGDAGYRYPFPPFPNGWFPIAFSHTLGNGQLIEKKVLGNEVVIYRTEAGVANVIGAYCPHLGAHIGKGGAVVGERIRCPFHHWEFGLNGRCEYAAGARRVPDASVETPHMVEKNGMIFLWHDSEGRAPHWDIPLLEETVSDDYFFVGHTEFHIKTHPQEMAENLPDFVHFRTVHGWNPDNFQWDCDYTEKFTSLTINVTANSDTIKTTNNIDKLHVTSLGPGYNFTRFIGRFRGLAILMFCPTEAGVLYSPLLFWAHKSIARDDARAWMEGYIRDYSLDIEILENKRYLSSPRMSDADGPIHKMRRWYQQWYA